MKKKSRQPSIKHRVRKAVAETLGTKRWPIYKTLGAGITEEDYFAFVMQVVGKTGLH